MLNSSSIIAKSGIQFGTSGARGLVTQFTAEVCCAFTHAFISSITGNFQFGKVAVAIDNRPSSPAMAQACIQAIQACGLEAVYYGVIPTPALAYSAIQEQIPCIMVTGSHIPFDRNGLKFYRPDGEITKVDELAILNAEVEFAPPEALPELNVDTKAAEQYIERYTSLFESDLLKGKRIGIYEHSSAGRDLYSDIFSKLGAEVISIGRSDQFVPIDTEAVSDEDKAKAKAWSKEYQLDFIFSTDGDGDRPLVADEYGEWLRGDILGLLCAQAMDIEAVAIPVSCNTVIKDSRAFSHVSLTKIGSPYVIAEFELLSEQYSAIAGFEANGGFLLGSDIKINGKTLKALPTRDAVLPALMVLVAGQQSGISSLVSQLPARYTDSDRVQNFATEKSREIIAKSEGKERALLERLGYDSLVQNVDTTDGLRMTLSNNDIIHLRPSGNAPELRCYAESDSADEAKQIVNTVLSNVQKLDVSAL
ncbi:phosphomannomutase [Vibrio furnissii]|uniref:Phosphomannomutase n=1 Tax=Vibrio furnissii TaxID=29494 RepID=A0A0Q2QUD4_VIBFU|nr:phosphomannomutase [Vibrio furnissii]KQH83637.1 phosphomannomutase [Vibrio furnissii]